MKGLAIEEYNAELVKRGADEVETSRRNALLVHDFGRFYSILNRCFFLGAESLEASREGIGN
jgi:nitrite reductase/ring-hydroxylating ferredoxin subunit